MSERIRAVSDAVEPLELTILMPCLNEAETLESCIRKATSALRELGVSGEVLVADNGSTDGSVEIAERLGARVVRVNEKGYGSALHGGVAAARGRFVLMGDADDSYDFGAVGPFLERLREGYDLVMGNRFRGGIEPGAMPWKHRYIGNPVLTGIGRLFFRCPAGDFHCGMRAFSKSAHARMDLRTTGMEYASEMVIKASIRSMRIAEVPTVLHRDGRSRPPHLRSWRDGWRHLRFMLLFSPRWLFLVPGLLAFAAGLGTSAWLVGGARRIGGMELDVHTLLVAGFVCLLGYQLILFAVFTKVFALREGLHPPRPRLEAALGTIGLEGGIVGGALLALVGVVALVAAVWGWRSAGFGALDPRVTMRQVIPAVVLLMLGAQTVFASFLIGILGLDRR